MENIEKWGCNKGIHGGHIGDKQFGSLATPIYQTSTFIFDSAEQGGRRLQEKKVDIYIQGWVILHLQK